MSLTTFRRWPGQQNPAPGRIPWSTVAGEHTSVCRQATLGRCAGDVHPRQRSSGLRRPTAGADSPAQSDAPPPRRSGRRAGSGRVFTAVLPPGFPGGAGEPEPTFPDPWPPFGLGGTRFAPCPAPDPLPPGPPYPPPPPAPQPWPPCGVGGECWPGGQLPPGWYLTGGQPASRA